MYNYVTLKELRPQLPKVIERVDSQLDRYIISKHGHAVAILLSIDDFESLIETLNEEADKKNLQRIRKGLRDAKAGRTVDWKKVKAKYHL